GAVSAEKGCPLILTTSHQRPEIWNVCAQRRVLSPSSFTRADIGRVREAAGMKRHRPSIRRAELGEAWHRSAGYAMSDRLVKRQHAALGRTGAIGEINRSRLQRSSGRTISVSIRTVASGA